jgi:hypothetical protein
MGYSDYDYDPNDLNLPDSNEAAADLPPAQGVSALAHAGGDPSARPDDEVTFEWYGS